MEVLHLSTEQPQALGKTENILHCQRRTQNLFPLLNLKTKYIIKQSKTILNQNIVK